MMCVCIEWASAAIFATVGLALKERPVGASRWIEFLDYSGDLNAGETFPLYAFYPSRHLPAAKVRALIDFVIGILNVEAA